MFFLSIPQAWHLVGTWSEQLPNESNLIGMGQTELMMTLHSIFVPLLLVISYYPVSYTHLTLPTKRIV